MIEFEKFETTKRHQLRQLIYNFLHKFISWIDPSKYCNKLNCCWVKMITNDDQNKIF